MKLALLCNNHVAFPALQQLHAQGISLHVGADAANTDLLPALSQYCTAFNAPLQLFKKEAFEAELHPWLDEVKPHAVLMMTFPFRIPEQALSKPKHGFLNFHYGLLPHYRGANPVFEQLRRREKQGGITLHQVEKGIDTGAVILQKQIPIHPTETFGMHMNRLSMLGAEMIQSVVSLLSSADPLPGVQQDNTKAVYYGKPGLNDVTINWSRMSAADIVALCNACYPWNYGAGMKLNGNTLGLSAAVILDNKPVSAGVKAGTIITTDPLNGLTVATADGKVLRLDMIYVDNSFMPGYQLALFGVMPGALLS